MKKLTKSKYSQVNGGLVINPVTVYLVKASIAYIAKRVAIGAAAGALGGAVSGALEKEEKE